jgi:hypothetical protein
MAMNKLRRWHTILLLLFVGCNYPIASPTATNGISDNLSQVIQPSTIPESEPTSQPQNTKLPPTRDLRIRIITTSDWTTLSLAEGAYLDDYEILSSSSEASVARFDQDRFEIVQPISQAETGQSVELVADLSITEDIQRGDLVLEINRGHIGATTVEISKFACGKPKVVETLTWEGIQPSGENIESFNIPFVKLLEPSNNEYIIIAQLNFWYYGPGISGGFENDLGNRSTPLTPLLGETYWASDPAVVHQQIEWAVEYGVDAFSIEWTTPRGVGCCGSMEDTLDNVFLKSPNINKVRWVIFYDFILRLDQTSGLKQYVRNLDFDEPEVYDTFVSDFRHFAQKYFGHPQYLKIDGRPVIYIWATNAYSGNLEGAIREARAEVADLGYDVFIVGDEVVANHYDPYHASLFDGNSTFTFLIPGLDITSWKDIGDATIAVDQTFERWRENIKDLKVTNREEYVNFQPAWAPQYDERLFKLDQGIYVPANSKAQVIAMAEVAQKHAQPVGSQGQKIVWLNTWNNWAETTTVEPTANLGPKYPAGNYQFDMLEVVREVFGVDTFACDLP